jgi:hypothetical protein
LTFAEISHSTQDATLNTTAESGGSDRSDRQSADDSLLNAYDHKMRVGTLVASRLSYANVVATLALFIALGGGAYAAFALPADSVGTRQLSFPLGVATRTDPTTTIPVYRCPPGAPCAPPVPKPIAAVSFTLKRPAKLLVLGSGYFAEPGTSATSTPVDIEIGALVDSVDELEEYELPVTSSPLKIWRIVSAPAGHQTIRLEADALAGSGSVPTVLAENPQITVVALPTLR